MFPIHRFSVPCGFIFLGLPFSLDLRFFPYPTTDTPLQPPPVLVLYCSWIPTSQNLSPITVDVEDRTQLICISPIGLGEMVPAPACGP